MHPIRTYQNWFNRNAPKIAAASVVTTLGVITYYNHKYGDKTLLEVTPRAMQSLMKGNALLYLTEDADLYLKALPR